ncbi:DJ-1/PfpI family protein [Sphaerisporangium corydalis]|uniref:DJ-1/PfpI family protein n=1 Tax=Sphaerisporangium corydalis TaxID=1441875 RepID=A0ABV9EIN8_9ACTN|nr:DJ-1/PfpI family protein [Sphaerisporangium corydalis]
MVNARVAILMESDFYEPEIFYYQRRFAEEGVTLDFLTRLWGQESITFTGHEYRAPFAVSKSLEHVDPAGYDAVIVPSGMVSDRLRYTEDVNRLAPATDFLRRAFEHPAVIKGIICHGMWLASSIPYTVRGRKIVCHNNLVGDVRNMGAEYVDEDVVVDGDLVTGRSGQHCHLFARTLVELLARKDLAPNGLLSQMDPSSQKDLVAQKGGTP